MSRDLLEASLVLTMGSDVVISSARYYVAVDFGTHGSGFAYMAKSDTNSNPRAYE